MFGFSITPTVAKIKDAEITVGVTDATLGSSGKSFGFHIGKARLYTSRDGHKLRRSSGRDLSVELPRKLPVDAEGRISVLAVINMKTNRLAFAVNGATPVDTGYTVPTSVRPWVWLGAGGVGSVVLTEHSIGAEPPPSVESSSESYSGLSVDEQLSHDLSSVGLEDKTPSRRPSADLTTGLTAAPAPAPAAPSLASEDVELDVAAPLPVVKPLALPLARANQLPADSTRSTSRTNTDSTERTSAESSVDVPTEWTHRATAWLKPLQELFMGMSREPDSVLTSNLNKLPTIDSERSQERSPVSQLV